MVKVESATIDRWCVLVGLLSQWAALRFMEDRVVVVARAAAVEALIGSALASGQWNAAALWTVKLERAAKGVRRWVELHGVVEGGWKVVCSWRVAVLARTPLRGGDRRSEVVPDRRARTIIIIAIVLARASVKWWWGRWHVVAVLTRRAGKQVRHEARHGEASV